MMEKTNKEKNKGEKTKNMRRDKRLTYDAFVSSRIGAKV